MKKYLAVDVGGTNIKYALMSEEAEFLEKGEVPTPTSDENEFVEAVGKIYDLYAGQAEALVMSAPGRVDSSRGFFYTGGALHFVSNTDMAALLKERIPIPFCAENDGKCAALAELWKGSMAGYQSGSVIVIGTGIGGAIILDGKLRRGDTFAAGEYSFIAGNWKSHYTCGAGEMWAGISSTTGLLAQYAEDAGIEQGSIDGRQYFAKVNAGDATAKKVLEDFCDYMAGGIYSLQVILDVQRFCIGGGISKEPVLMETLNKQVDALWARMPFYSPAAKPEVVRCTFGNDANLIGALYHYLFEIQA